MRLILPLVCCVRTQLELLHTVATTYVGRGGRTDATEGVNVLSKNGAVEACVGALRANAGNDAVTQLATRLLELLASSKRCVCVFVRVMRW